MDVGAQASGAFSSADFDGDGQLDLVLGVANPIHKIHLALGDGAGDFQLELEWDYPCGHFAVGDFDDDGEPDFAGGEYTDMRVYLNQGATFPYSTYGISEGDGPGGLSDMAVFDFDGENGPDIVATGSGGSEVVTVFQNDGLGAFVVGASLAITPHVLDTNAALAVGDFDGDHFDDVLIGTSDGTQPTVGAVFLGNTGGGFAPVTYTSASNADGNAVRGLVAGRFNPADDEHLDALLVGFYVPTTKLSGGGAGDFETSEVDVGWPWSDQLSVGDLNYDLADDLMLNVGDGDVALWRSNAMGQFLPAPSLDVSEDGANIYDIQPLDYDGDGVLDVGVLFNPGVGTDLFLSLWRNTSGDP
jgi:hypothetical protein